jgi:hypothetical protein
MFWLVRYPEQSTNGIYSIPIVEAANLLYRWSRNYYPTEIMYIPVL